MSTVFTGESKIFQLAAVNPDSKAKAAPVITANTTVIEGIIADSLAVGKLAAKGASMRQVRPVLDRIFNGTDYVADFFLDYAAKKNMPWDETLATWRAYEDNLKAYANKEVIRRMSAQS